MGPGQFCRVTEGNGEMSMPSTTPLLRETQLPPIQHFDPLLQQWISALCLSGIILIHCYFLNSDVLL